MRSGSTILGLFLAVTLLTTVAVMADTPVTAAEEGITFYGYLKLPHTYFSHPASKDVINHVQPGTVLFVSGDRVARVPVQPDGAFTVYNLPYGTYLVQCDFHDFQFPTVRVEVQYKDTPSGDRIPIMRSSRNDFPVKLLEGTGIDDANPVVIPAEGVHMYYIPREQFSVLDILKNPMILLMLVSFGLLGLMKLFPEEDVKSSREMSRAWQKKFAEAASGGSSLLSGGGLEDNSGASPSAKKKEIKAKK